MLGDYVKSSIKVEIRHNKCGHIYFVTPNKFQQGRRCPECANIARGLNRRKTNGEFIREVRDLVGDEYEFLEDYSGYFTKIKVIHNKCGHVYEVLPSNFLFHGQRCPEEGCFRKRKSESQAMTHEDFTSRIKGLVGKEYTILGRYRNSVTPIKIRHNTCGHEYSVTPGNFVHSGKR